MLTSRMKVSLLYFDGCPNWRIADERLRHALTHVGRADARVEYRKVRSPEEAAANQFRGSPTILIDGVDPFADPDSPVGLSCRVYPTSEGLSGAPTVTQLTRLLA
jgi:hypothetical protein